MKARLYEKYMKEVVPALKEKRKYGNVHQIPKMEKIVVNMGVSASLEKNALDDAAKDLALITGRKPAVSKSRHSIANFKLRLGQPIGCHVTLRRDAMYEFFDRLVATALPRIRDFRGLSPRSFDGRGNYWSRYRGFDFDGDGIGETPHPVVGAFERLEGANAAARLFLQSPAAAGLDLAARLSGDVPFDALDAKPLIGTRPRSDRRSGIPLATLCAAAACALVYIGRSPC